MQSRFFILCRALPFAVYIAFLALDSHFSVGFLALGLDAKWLYAIRFLCVSALLMLFWRQYSELFIWPKSTNFIYAVIAGLLVFLIWILPYPAWMLLAKDAPAFNPLLNQASADVVLWVSTRMLGTALMVPVMEELFWRSFLMRWIESQQREEAKSFLYLSPELVSLYALIVSSVLFALEHQLWLAGLIAGLVYGQLYRVYKNLWVPIVAHGVTNGVLGVWVLFTGNWQYW